MARYIELDALVAEIKKRMQELRPTNTHQIQVGEKMDRDVLMWLNALTWVKNLLDTIEVKEVDLHKELDDYIEKQKAWVKDDWVVEYNNGDSFNHIYDLEKIAKHFFELGLKAQKGK